MSVLRARDAVRGNDAKCFVTIDGSRYEVFTLMTFEGSISYSNAEINRLGAGMTGHKQGIGSGSWSATGVYGTPMFRKMLMDYKTTGYFPVLEIQVLNEDKTSAVGRQTVVYKDCLIDEYILSKFDVDSEYLDEDISGTFDDWELPEQFTALDGMA